MKHWLLLIGLAASTLTGCGGDEGAGNDNGPDEDEDVPAYCQDVTGWAKEWTTFEDEVLRLVNEVRAIGYDCDSEGTFGPAGPLTRDLLLRCSARKHSKDMADQGYFSHTGKDGSQPWDRIDRTEYDWSAVGENIALGTKTPQETMDGWLESDGHCANIMAPEFTQLGVGYFYTADPIDDRYLGHYWTQNFGTPR